MTTLRSLVPKLPEGLLYGGDYNPEQWPESVWREDARLMREAGVNFVSVGIFAWAKLEPQPGRFELDWLGRVLDLLGEHGVAVCLATATASPPAWLSRAHPESLPVDANGTRLSPGSRQHYCPNSRAYRTLGARLIDALARRFADHPAVALWHLNNEIGCHVSECFCDVCAGDFRGWLKARHGSLEALNEAWGTAFWSQAYGEWDEILPPRRMPTFRNPGHALDYARFMSDSLGGILAGEVAAIRAVARDARVTTNGMPYHRPTDYHAWFPSMDVAAWDSYPDPAAGLDEVRLAAANHDLFRSLGRGRPFLLMEQATSQVNWRPTNVPKAPGQMRALSLAAVAHGADAVMFFQWRASRAGAEKFHSALVPHFGADGSRVFDEARRLGSELKKLGSVCGARTPARVALVFSWENRWALELESKPMTFDYVAIVQFYYAALWDLGIAVDVIHPDAALDSYAVVVAPALYQLTTTQADALREHVRRGGALVMSYFSGVADENDHIRLGGYPALLQSLLGLAVEEWAPLPPGKTNSLAVRGAAKRIRCEKFCEIIHLRGAEAIATYTEDFFTGRAAVTRHRFEKGEAFYVGTQPDAAWLRGWLDGILRARGLVTPVHAAPGVGVAVRQGESDEFLFVINHTADSVRVDFRNWSGPDLLGAGRCAGVVTLEPFGVRVLGRERAARGNDEAAANERRPREMKSRVKTRTKSRRRIRSSRSRR